MSNYSISSTTIIVPNEKIAKTIFADCLGLKPLVTSSKNPMIFHLNKTTIIICNLPEDGEYNKKLHIYAPTVSFKGIVDNLKKNNIPYSYDIKQYDENDRPDSHLIRIIFEEIPSEITISDRDLK